MKTAQCIVQMRMQDCVVLLLFPQCLKMVAPSNTCKTNAQNIQHLKHQEHLRPFKPEAYMVHIRTLRNRVW